MQRAIQLDDKNSVYRCYLALADLMVGDVDSATSSLENLLAEDPENIRYRYYLASALVRAKQYASTIPLLQTITEGNGLPEAGFEVILLLANCHSSLGEQERAAETLIASLTTGE